MAKLISRGNLHEDETNLLGYLQRSTYTSIPVNHPEPATSFSQEVVSSIQWLEAMFAFFTTEVQSDLKVIKGSISDMRSQIRALETMCRASAKPLKRKHDDRDDPNHPLRLTKTKLAADGEPVPDRTLYRSFVGALLTRPDIAYVVQQGTLSHGLHIKASAVDRLVAYSDADWAGCPNTRRSTSGFCVYLGDNLISWSSKRQHVVSRSSVEAEYRGIANVVAETAWLRNLLLELSCPLSRATIVFCDNVSAMYLASNPVQCQRTKHVEIDLHFVRECVVIGHVRVLHVPSAYQYADIFTKNLPTSLFLDFRNSLNIRLPPDQTSGVC
ncbi:hypothetical protein OSB04_023934 [Centaurea solstitialis]|uniref:Uncharacterized protein n=1 Tax=Centaurea solstitialis TaxID=347529 RepID=A0AA38T3M6_9ASTR|nr:hypothetical protein OSB04_023934 [Centaurea solstitialis]